MFKELSLRWKNYTGNNAINISGEILISNKDVAKLLKLTAEEQDKINQLNCHLTQKFPYLKTEIVQSICEVSIKVFAYNIFTGNKNFLNDLCLEMENVVKKVLEDKELSVRLNIFGEFTTTKLRQQFRYLNKQEIVEYSITHEEKLGIKHIIFSRAIRIYFFILMFLGLLVQTGYLYYIQTCPNKASEFIEKYLHLSQNL
jgi:hypothetical protein